MYVCTGINQIVAAAVCATTAHKNSLYNYPPILQLLAPLLLHLSLFFLLDYIYYKYFDLLIQFFC